MTGSEAQNGGQHEREKDKFFSVSRGTSCSKEKEHRNKEYRNVRVEMEDNMMERAQFLDLNNTSLKFLQLFAANHSDIRNET